MFSNACLVCFLYSARSHRVCLGSSQQSRRTKTIPLATMPWGSMHPSVSQLLADSTYLIQGLFLGSPNYYPCRAEQTESVDPTTRKL